MASYRSLTNQILIFGILDLNFQSEFQHYAGSSLASSVLLCCPPYLAHCPVKSPFLQVGSDFEVNMKQNSSKGGKLNLRKKRSYQKISSITEFLIPLCREVSSWFVLGVPLPCLGSS